MYRRLAWIKPLLRGRRTAVPASNPHLRLRCGLAVAVVVICGALGAAGGRHISELAECRQLDAQAQAGQLALAARPGDVGSQPITEAEKPARQLLDETRTAYIQRCQP